LFAVSAVIIASLALAGPAGAAPGSGAQVVNTHECYVYVDFTICESLHSVYNPTETGSGNSSVVINTRFDNTFTGTGPLAGCSERTTGSNQQHYTTNPDGPQQQHSRLLHQYTVDCPGAAYSCTFEQNYTYANGDLRHEKSRHECTATV
jgi:hypothetical protein